ncbi:MULTISPECIES: DUF4282 domain-containing protein [Acinetobacter]|jgi:hypothetical protein|uniref:DUF4282 domain-containing protein n=1 Tax=Acinetobacter bereziniae NIPH 3 TaxID=1217651 RepID=N8XG53_ACIBZ|nr:MULTISPECIES: DUF4282 domain-containing protein [Acinetobacter]ENV23492.1 hypothetical protein F963_00606 [Acinetobacter bereziniae NIPH 3]MDR3027824.1 DUF4282 domain-containing protein [Acinetobacter sp.]MDV8155122.1 DUF4282 domain-containing protein [Acinetobacter bereziniae]
MNNLLTLNDMLTPKIVTVLYWLGLIGVVIAALTTLFGFGYGAYTGFFSRLFSAILIIVFGGLAVRVYSELLIVIFKIHENLKKIADRQP